MPTRKNNLTNKTSENFRSYQEPCIDGLFIFVQLLNIRSFTFQTFMDEFDKVVYFMQSFFIAVQYF